MSSKSRYSIDILDVALDLVEYLASKGGTPKNATQMARQLEISHNRVFRVLKTLEARGYVVRTDEPDGYQLAEGFVALGDSAREQGACEPGRGASRPRPAAVEPPRLFWQPRPAAVGEPDARTRLGLPEQSEEERRTYETEARNLVEAGREQGITLRILGGVAFGLQCPGHAHLHQMLGRSYSDINLAARRDQASQTGRFFASLGYAEDAYVNLTYGDRQMIFYHPMIRGLHLDIYFDRLDFCHPISWVDRLEINPLTLPLADLLMEKLQIVRINEKDLIDIIVLLLEHPLANDDREAINVAYIARLCANDWGMWRTFLLNLDKVGQMVRAYQQLDGKAKARVGEQVVALRERIEREPKSLTWRLRARVGERVKWYREVDDIG